MPTISMFFGILIRMYVDDHNPPHFHALYQGFSGIFDFDGNQIEGNIPSKQRHLIKAWALIHREDLEANWLLATNNETLFKINPLQ